MDSIIIFNSLYFTQARKVAVKDDSKEIWVTLTKLTS